MRRAAGMSRTWETLGICVGGGRATCTVSKGGSRTCRESREGIGWRGWKGSMGGESKKKLYI